jgi:hypothetical protein
MVDVVEGLAAEERRLRGGDVGGDLRVFGPH